MSGNSEINKVLDSMYKRNNSILFLQDTIQDEFNRLCVTESKDELDKLIFYIKYNLDKLYKLKEEEINELNKSK